jgi:hypothetical protein
MVFNNPASLSYFPNGVAQITTFLAGGSAGDHTLSNIKSDDMLLAVQAISWDSDGDVASVTGLLDEFTISADDTINNTGGTDTTDMLLAVTVAAGPKRYSAMS